MDESWEVVVRITGPDVDIEIENIHWKSVPKALIEAYRSFAPTLIDSEIHDPVEKRLHTEIVEAMEKIIEPYERHTVS
jgi:hypothetical protein